MESENIFRTRNTFISHIEYFYTSFIILMIKLKEYKAGSYSAFIEQLVFYGVKLTFAAILITNFGDIISWTIYDIILMLLIADFIHVTSNLMIWDRFLFFDIYSGKLNNYINKPINPFFCYQFGSLSIASIVYSISCAIAFIFFIFYFDVEFYNVILSIVFFIIIFLTYLSNIFFINSISFFSVGLSKSLYKIEWEGNSALAKSFPHKFFETGNINVILFIFIIFFVSSLIVPLLRDYPVWNLELQLIIMFSLLIFYSIATYLLWKIGLKQYGAYG